MSSPNPHLFEDPDGEVFHAIGWIRCRSKDQFGAMNDLDDFRTANLYGPPELNPWKAAKALLRELRSGHIPATKDRQLLHPEYLVSDRLLATTLGLYQRSAGVFVPSARILEEWPYEDICRRRVIIVLSARIHKLLLLQAAVQTHKSQPQADATEIAPAAKTTSHVVEQSTSPSAPDASLATQRPTAAAGTEDQIIADTVSSWTPRSGKGGPHQGLQAEILRKLERHTGTSTGTLKKRKPLMAKIRLAIEN